MVDILLILHIFLVVILVLVEITYILEISVKQMLKCRVEGSHLYKKKLKKKLKKIEKTINFELQKLMIMHMESSV